MANYVIVGAGGDASNPIQVNVRCDDSTTICWTGKYCKTVCGVEMCAEDQYCETVSTTSEGPHQTTWTDPDGINHTVYYNVKRDCPPVVPPSCEYTCSDLTAYAVPSSVEENYTGNIDIHYEYYLTCVSGDYIGDRVKKSGVKTVPFSSFSDYSYNLSVDGCNTTVKLDKKEDDDCTEGCVADISISFSQNVVPASGKTIQVIVSFKKTVTDENCKKKVTTGSFSYPWEVKCTPVDENDKHCCKDHYVQGWISEAEVKRLGKLDGCELRYDGEQTALDFYYKVLQRGKTTEECEGYCEEKTTYCVDQSTVKVCYEKRYLSNEWVCEGDPSTDCDCTALSIEGVNGAYAVPFTGGRIKVTWQYSAHTTTETCNEYDTLGKTWEEIITIGGCDERPIDCKPEYNTVVVDEEGHTAIYDDTTYKDCEICDSECCYNYDGKGRCKCVILFKEQTPGCTTCESCDVYDEEEQRTITYNKIRYEFVQDCTTICNYDKNTQFEQKEINVDKCFTGETAATVPFTSTTEYYGAGCPAPEVIIDSVEAKANIPTVNNSNRPKVAYEDDMIKVIQAAGPCEVPTYCDCDALTLEGGGGGDCPEGEVSYVYGTVNIECRAYSNESVDVPYTKYCNGSPIGSGTSSKTISIDCNKGTSRTKTVNGVKVHQAGGCTDEQCGATPPASDCACSVTWGVGPCDNEFDCIVDEFREYVDIAKNGTTYNYLRSLYDEAHSQYYDGHSTVSGVPALYKEENFPNVYNYYGNAGIEANTFSAMTGWLFALQLTELKPKKRVGILKTGYNIGGYTYDANVFGYKFKTDPNVARLVASAIYSTMRNKLSPRIDTMRTEVGGSTYSNTLQYYRDLNFQSRENVERYCLAEDAFYIDFREFLPTAPGPYLEAYSSRPLHIIPDAKDSRWKNTNVDLNIHENTIIPNYNLDSTNATYKQMAVQAIADKDWHIQHLFGDNRSGGGYSWHPVYGMDTIGKRLSDSSDSYVAKLTDHTKYLGSDFRFILQTVYVTPAQYGRFRPGCSWTTEGQKNSTTDDRRNVLCDYDIEMNDGHPETSSHYNQSGQWVEVNVANITPEQYCENEKNYLFAASYPSGHSSGIWSAGMTLMELMPERADKIMKVSNQFAINRTIARFHWTSDTIIGRVIGSAANVMCHDASDFNTLLTNAKNEL